MCYLRRYLAGDALESVSGYFLYDDEKTGYEDARAELTRQFGDKFAIAKPFRTH